MRPWDRCGVPISVTLMRDRWSDGTVNEWRLATTDPGLPGDEVRRLYACRAYHEESHRQMKCFWDLGGFRSCKRSLVASQVGFVALAHSLMQAFLMQSDRGHLTRQTRERLLERLLPEGSKIVLYCGNRAAFLRALEHQELVLGAARDRAEGFSGRPGSCGAGRSSRRSFP